MTRLEDIPVARLQAFREDIRLGRKVMDVKQALALVDLVLRAKADVHRAATERARLLAQDLFDLDGQLPAMSEAQPARLPGDAHG